MDFSAIHLSLNFVRLVYHCIVHPLSIQHRRNESRCDASSDLPLRCDLSSTAVRHALLLDFSKLLTECELDRSHKRSMQIVFPSVFVIVSTFRAIDKSADILARLYYIDNRAESHG